MLSKYLVVANCTLAVLIETMRREGYELQVGKPRVIFKTINDKLCEPLEALTIDVPQEFMGTVMENLGQRKAELTNMVELAGYLRMEFVIPARGLIGFRAQFLTATKVMVYEPCIPWLCTIQRRKFLPVHAVPGSI